MLGGVAWERLPVDPKPGPAAGRARSRRATRSASTRCSPARETATADGVPLLRVARGGPSSARPTVLIDITGGAAGAAEGIAAAAGLLGCDLVIYVDVGGDAIADRRRARARRARSATRSCSPPGCGSATAWTASRRDRRRLRRRADPRRGARAGRGARRAPAPGSGPRASTRRAADELERRRERAGSEASMQVARCAPRRARRRPRSAAAAGRCRSARSARSASASTSRRRRPSCRWRTRSPDAETSRPPRRACRARGPHRARLRARAGRRRVAGEPAHTRGAPITVAADARAVAGSLSAGDGCRRCWRSRRSPPLPPTPGAYGDDDAGGFLNILPPGQGQSVNAAEIGAFLGHRHAPAARLRPAADVRGPRLRDPGPEEAELDELLQGRDLRRRARATSSAPTARATT